MQNFTPKPSSDAPMLRLVNDVSPDGDASSPERNLSRLSISEARAAAPLKFGRVRPTSLIEPKPRRREPTDRADRPDRVQDAASLVHSVAPTPVSTPLPGPRLVSPPTQEDVDAVTRENVAAARSAAALTPGDARWVFAVRVASALEAAAASGASTSGKPAPLGVLPPDRRDRLLQQAKHLGLRPFDASLVVAICQDSARRGLHPLGPTAAASLEMVPKPEPRRSSVLNTLIAAAASTVLAGVLVLMAIDWLMGA